MSMPNVNFKLLGQILYKHSLAQCFPYALTGQVPGTGTRPGIPAPAFFDYPAPGKPYSQGPVSIPFITRQTRMYRLVQKKETVLLITSLAWPAVAGCSRAETFSQLTSIFFCSTLYYLCQN